jgi:hypothetical protein
LVNSLRCGEVRVRRCAYIRGEMLMKWTPWILGALTALAIGACGGERRDNGTSDTGTESGTMRGGASTDTAVPGTGSPGTTSDTAQGGAYLRSDTATAGTGTSDSARGNQTEPITSKSDTVGHPPGH